MKGVNKAIIVGSLGADPDVRCTQNGKAVANISVATTERWKDSNGEISSSTEWHRIVFFNRLAEVAGQYLKKGSKVYVEGRLQTRKWQDQSGADRYTTEIVASEMQMLDSRGQEDKSSAPPKHAEVQQDPQGGFSDFDDDIPFSSLMKNNEYLI